MDGIRSSTLVFDVMKKENTKAKDAPIRDQQQELQDSLARLEAQAKAGEEERRLRAQAEQALAKETEKASSSAAELQELKRRAIRCRGERSRCGL
ncbi:unnamed protein product [Effrenium voratum]|uniref:Uncharacterized protein n=1 Tax=Effrenium voratum TaxID=2562239 RepID=A0AA36N7N2_9DINO|nr:unnamed protein product [Effrenium voratum]CAJ1443113.1 unnamed protein product [Effrenium voratum]